MSHIEPSDRHRPDGLPPDEPFPFTEQSKVKSLVNVLKLARNVIGDVAPFDERTKEIDDAIKLYDN